MFKTLQISFFSVLLLGSCSFSQNYVNTNSGNLTKNENAIDLKTFVENTPPFKKEVVPSSNKIECKYTNHTTINIPRLNEAHIINSVSEKEMIDHLLDHIEKLDKIIGENNAKIIKINKLNKRECR